MRYPISNPDFVSQRIPLGQPGRPGRMGLFEMSAPSFSPVLSQAPNGNGNGEPPPAPAPESAPQPEPAPQPQPEIEERFVFPVGTTTVACPVGDGTFMLLDARTLGFIGRTFALPIGTYVLTPGDPRCVGMAVAPPAEPVQRILVTEPVSTNTLLVSGAIAAVIALIALT